MIFRSDGRIPMKNIAVRVPSRPASCVFYVALLAVLFLSSLKLVAQGQSPTFTYQGKLTRSGAPATGSFDFIFSIFEDAAQSKRLGTNIAKEKILVKEGNFSVDLPGGPEVFTGDRRWLKIEVRPTPLPIPAPAEDYTELPLQEITPAPFSVTAINSFPNGIKSFTSTGTYTIKNDFGTTKFVIELLGGAGGGGGKGTDYTPPGGGGGGIGGGWGGYGGDGAFTRCILKVPIGAIITVVVGHGTSKVSLGENGQDGGDSSVSYTQSDGAQITVMAGGGRGGKQGQNATATDGGGAGADGAEGSIDPSPLVFSFNRKPFSNPGPGPGQAGRRGMVIVQW